MALPLAPLLFLLTNPYVIAGIAGLLAFTFGFTFFFDKIFILSTLAVGGWLFFKKANGNISGSDIIPLIALPLLVFTFWNFFGVAGMVSGFDQPTGTIATDQGPVQPPQAEVQVSEPKGQGSTVPGLSTTLAPRTYREVDITVKNNDNQLPLVLDSAKVMAWIGECNTIDEQKQHPICNAEAGNTLKIQSGWLNGLGQFTKKLFEQNNVGITGKNPEERNIWDKTTNDWKDLAVMKNFDVESEAGEDTVALWSKSSCEQYSNSNVDCDNVQGSHTFENVGYIWADQDAEVPSQKTLNVAVLMPQSKSLTDTIIWAGTLGGVDRQDYTVVAMKQKTVNVATPDIQIIILIGGLGLLASLGAYFRVPPFNVIPVPGA